MGSASLKKTFLYILIGSVALSALLGILAILVGDFGEFELKVLFTSLTISGASLCGLCCGAALDARRARILPIIGIGLALASAVLVTVAIWAEFGSGTYWKTAATATIAAVSCSHLSLLLVARLASRFAWAMWAAYAAVGVVALILTSLLWGHFNEDPIFRILGVAAILDGALTVLIPILHRLSGPDIERHSDSAAVRLAEIDQEITRLHSRLDELERLRQQLV